MVVKETRYCMNLTSSYLILSASIFSTKKPFCFHNKLLTINKRIIINCVKRYMNACLKIPNGISETFNRRRTDNLVVNRKKNKNITNNIRQNSSQLAKD